MSNLLNILIDIFFQEVGGLFFFPFEIIPFQETSLFGFRSLLYMLKWLRYSIANWNSVLFAQKIKLFFYP